MSLDTNVEFLCYQADAEILIAWQNVDHCVTAYFNLHQQLQVLFEHKIVYF